MKLLKTLAPACAVCLLFTLFTFVSLAAGAAPAVAQSQELAMEHESIPTVTVQGHGEVMVDPDEAIVRLGVVAQREAAADAQREANRVITAILADLEELGIEADRVQTARLQLYPVYDQRRRPDEVSDEPRIVGYQATSQLSVRLSDLSKIGPAIDAAIGSGANSIDGVDFQVRDDRAAREQALERAVAEARAKAGAIARALEVELGPVMRVEEAGVSFRVPQLQAKSFAREAMAMDVATPVSPGQATVSADVTVSYRLNR